MILERLQPSHTIFIVVGLVGDVIVVAVAVARLVDPNPIPEKTTVVVIVKVVERY